MQLIVMLLNQCASNPENYMFIINRCDSHDFFFQTLGTPMMLSGIKIK
jgi:hypothetical protein